MTKMVNPASCLRPISKSVHQRDLLDWYDRHRRDLPWRAGAGRRGDPYHIWLSEIMLQQTTVATVRGYFDKFIRRWPTVAELAAADLDDVLAAWAGLGYYARARNLYSCAQMIVADYGGVFPDHEDGLRILPGVGAYTAAAIAAIAFDRPATVIDGNVDRIITRLAALDTPIRDNKKQIRALADDLFARVEDAAQPRAGDFAQAMMDLGATICVPRQPLCLSCPWQSPCLARQQGIAAALPVKPVKAQKKQRNGLHLILYDAAYHRMLVHRRPPRGLLGGMLGVPGPDWREGDVYTVDELSAILSAWGLDALELIPLPGVVRHSFTHFDLEAALVVAPVSSPRHIAVLDSMIAREPEWQWLMLEKPDQSALPTVFAKMVQHFLSVAPVKQKTVGDQIFSEIFS